MRRTRKTRLCPRSRSFLCGIATIARNLRLPHQAHLSRPSMNGSIPSRSLYQERLHFKRWTSADKKKRILNIAEVKFRHTQTSSRSTASLILILSSSTVMIAPFSNNCWWLFITELHTSACLMAEMLTKRIIHECGIFLTIASSPKSLSSVTKTRFSF